MARRHYRIYRLNVRGNIMDGSWLEAEDDEDAKRLAQGQFSVETPAIEVWDRERLVARLTCPSAGTPSS